MTWYTTLGAVVIFEQIYRSKGSSGTRLRPFSECAQLHCRLYSKKLERVMTDFGADHSFEESTKKIKEHYGVEVPRSVVRLCTEKHGKQIFKGSKGESPVERQAQGVIIAETDGSMIPIVEARKSRGDKRKKKALFWKEARLSLAYEKGSKTPCFEGTLRSVKVAGKLLKRCVKRAGASTRSLIHCVGDGALWIADQVESQFGKRGSYLIDFYHLCEYLSAAAPTGPTRDAWIEEQKSRMKRGEKDQVLQALRERLEPEKIEKAPVRACYRYLENRENQFDYPKAIQEELPIGSGEIESAHRYVIQKRLKLPGTWWRLDHAEHMLALRVLRANGSWDSYWGKKAA